MPGFLGGSTSGGGGTGGEISFPKEFVDPVTKLRVSQPETLIDTDFEYGLQPTKWETVELINNTPSFFSKSGDTTIPNIVSITTNAGTREITVTTALDHGLAVGIPINVQGTKSITADGSYIINSIPNTVTFTYLCKDNQTETLSIEDLYTSIITGEFFQGSQLRIADSEGITTDGDPVSILTVKTESAHGFGVNTPFYFLNLNSTVAQEFEAANTAAKSFDSTNSATAQTFDGSNTLSQIQIDWSNSATIGGTPSSIVSVSTADNTITVTHTTETFAGQPLGTPLYYEVTAAAGYFSSNPRGVVFLKTTDQLASGTSIFQISAVPDGTAIDIETSMSGTFQLANQARTFAGNNVNEDTQQEFDIILGEEFSFDGANDPDYTVTPGTIPNKLATVTGYSGSLVNVSVSAGAGLEFYTGAMVLYSTTGSAASGLTNNTTYFVDTFLPAGGDNYSFTLKNFPNDENAITSISGGTGTQTFTRIGVSLDKNIVHVRNSNFVKGDMLKYSFPENGNFVANINKEFYFVETAYDGNNYRLGDSTFSPMSATGGTITDIFEDGIQYKVHTFTTTGTSTFTVTDTGSEGGEVEYLIVAGGGGGGRYGGGGGGGVLQGTFTTSAQAYSVVVGIGGIHPSGTTSPSGRGNNGGNSSVFGLTAIGGGGGADSGGSATGGNGGSGGGGGYENFAAGTGVAGPPRQGYSGGTGTNNGSSYSGGGGGGAGQAGGNASVNLGGKGGDGINSRISGFNLSYAAGGGGPTFRNDDQSGIGGSNGLGGLGAKYGGGGPVSVAGWGGVTNRGSGGSSGYSGGSGIVIIRYPVTSQDIRPCSATGGSISNITVGGIPYRLHTFTTVGSSTFTITDPGTIGRFEYLLVGGGGSGASSGSSGSGPRGGGGAGGMLTDKELPLPISFTSAGSYTVTIGAGGAGTSTTTVGEIDGSNGQNSSFASLVALGGGGGGTYKGGTGPGLNGASGGGSSYTYNESQGVQLQGNRGRGSANGAGGGGGAGGMGERGSGVSNDGGAGGIGRISDITGSNVYYAGGGGAGAYPQGTNNMGAGGLGGGGRGGGGGSSLKSVAGTANTGGGGGGGGSGAIGAAGGSGIFIIRYPLAVAGA